MKEEYLLENNKFEINYLYTFMILFILNPFFIRKK
jgi:hypothetical protein